jgi:YD repeat-containing protein
MAGSRSPSYVISLNWTTGDMAGEVDDYYSLTGNGYSDDENFPYARELYENSPLGRVVETGLPGLTFAVGRSHTALASYTKNNKDNFYGAFPAGSFPLGQYFETVNISPDGVWTHTLTDKAGNTIATRSGPNGSGIYPTTSYQYDDFGNVVQINPPNYHNPPAGSVAGDWPIVMSYDFFGRLKQKTTPDAQATYFYIYDKAGRVRFMMDANGGTQNPDHVQYWKYDALGRAIECGYLVQDWNATTLQNYADTNPTWPSTPSTWRKKYTYDYNGATAYLKGRQYKVETNNNSDTVTEVEETFAYDIYGNVVNKTAKVLDYNASSYGIAYEYDHGGNVTRMTYIPASLVLQNETVGGIISYSAVDSITAGPSYTVASGASAVLQAGKKIRLVPGFTAQQGSYFNAKIDPFLTQDATVVTYSYDALGRLISVGTPSDADFYASYTYHADGRLNTEILANGAETRNHFYNSPGWLLRIDGDRFTEDITHTTGWGGAAGYYDGRIKTTSFTYNWAGKPADYAVQYTYDDVGQLTSADNNLNNAWDIGIGNTISYDPNGNILDLRRGSVTKNHAYHICDLKFKIAVCDLKG